MVLFIELHYNGRKLKIANTMIISEWGNRTWEVQQLVRAECPLAGEQGWKYGFHHQSLCSFGYSIPADMLVLTGAQRSLKDFERHLPPERTGNVICATTPFGKFCWVNWNTSYFIVFPCLSHSSYFSSETAWIGLIRSLEQLHPGCALNNQTSEQISNQIFVPT